MEQSHVLFNNKIHVSLAHVSPKCLVTIYLTCHPPPNPPSPKGHRIHTDDYEYCGVIE